MWKPDSSTHDCVYESLGRACEDHREVANVCQQYWCTTTRAYSTGICNAPALSLLVQRGKRKTWMQGSTSERVERGSWQSDRSTLSRAFALCRCCGGNLYWYRNCKGIGGRRLWPCYCWWSWSDLFAWSPRSACAYKACCSSRRPSSTPTFRWQWGTKLAQECVYSETVTRRSNRGWGWGPVDDRYFDEKCLWAFVYLTAWSSPFCAFYYAGTHASSNR